MRNVEVDLKILADAFSNSLHITNCEYGAIGLDCKRPLAASKVNTVFHRTEQFIRIRAYETQDS